MQLIFQKYIFMGGFFGTIKNTACSTDLFYGIDYNSHMGTRRGGMVTINENGDFIRAIHNLEKAYFRNKFEDDLASFVGNAGIGVISDTDPQPMVMKTRIGKYAMVTVAKINNMAELEEDVLSKGAHIAELSLGKTCPTELIGLLISQGKDILDGIENAYQKVKGSFSTLLLTQDGIIAARDYYGRTPIVIGKHFADGYAVSSESSAFTNLGYESEYFLGPGEVVLITADGIKQLRKPNDKMQICSFLWIYYGFPVSEYEGINVDNVRRKLGKSMASRDTIIPDFVSGIPDSGVGMALGYSEESKIPYRRAITKYTPTWPRSFTPPTQDVRELVAKMKLIANKKMLDGRSVVFCDDSIVRGTQLRDNVEILYNYGAKDVHMRISCPPLVYPCPYINFSASKSVLELITRRTIEKFEGSNDIDLEEYSTFGSEKYNKMVNEIREQLHISTLDFVSMDELVKAIGLPKEKLCTHCFDGCTGGCE